MEIQNLPFCTIDWKTLEPTKHTGETGYAL